jgi:hypothetical protein
LVKLVVHGNNRLREIVEVVGEVTAFHIDEEVLRGCLGAIKVVLNLCLVSPVEVADKLNETCGVIRGRTSLLEALELP